MKLTNHDKTVNIMRELACFGIEKRLIKHFSNMNPRMFNEYYNSYCVVPHREGVVWLNNHYAGFLADRVIRIYEKVVGSNVDSLQPLTAEQLLDVTKAYLALYPRDDMSANRIFYLIRSIKTGIVGVERACKSCSKPYHVHGLPGGKCGACNILDKKATNANVFNLVANGSRIRSGNIGYQP